MVPLLMSDIIIRNNSGPRTVPWGTPLKTGLSLLIPSGGIQPVRTGSLEPVPRQSHILRTGY